jgi:hypothetical protein
MPPSVFLLRMKSIIRDEKMKATEMTWDKDRGEKAGSISPGS